VIFFVAYFTYANDPRIDALSFGFSIAFSMTITSMIHVFLQTTRIDLSLISSIIVSFLTFLGFTLAFDMTCVTCLNGQSSYGVSYSMFRRAIFWWTNLFTIVTAMIPRFVVKCFYNTTVNPLFRDDDGNNLPTSTQTTRL